MASENPGWGYTRIRGALRNLGQQLGRSTIKRILADAGIEPAPERGKRTSCATFLKAHWGAIAATDFFNVEVLTSAAAQDIPRLGSSNCIRRDSSDLAWA